MFSVRVIFAKATVPPLPHSPPSLHYTLFPPPPPLITLSHPSPHLTSPLFTHSPFPPHHPFYLLTHLYFKQGGRKGRRKVGASVNATIMPQEVFCGHLLLNQWADEQTKDCVCMCV